jgi:hypothetical protein
LRRAGLATLVGAAIACGACSNFPDVSSILDLRVLSVRTEPSEIILDDTDPSTNPPIAVLPLLPDGTPGHGPVTWTLAACPNNPYGAAPPGGDVGGGMLGGGARTTVGSNLCDPASPTTWQLITDPVTADTEQTIDTAPTIQFTADQLAAAAAADVYVDQFGNPHGGLDLGLPMNLQLTATDGVETVVAIKRVLFWYTGPDLYWKGPLDPTQMPNQTPLIPSVLAYHDRDENDDPVPPLLTFGTTAPQQIAAGDHLWVQPVMLAGTAEPYWTAVIDPDSHLAVPLHIDKERIRYAFYASAGTFTPPRSASELPPGFVGTPHLESEYQAPPTIDGLPQDDNGNGLVTIWIVVRDERGGESWVERQIALTPQ